MIVTHESDLSRLPDTILKRNGFKKMGKRKDSYTHSLQINERHAILYDSSGFITWIRRVSPKGRILALLLIPEPVRTERDLKVIVGNVRLRIGEIEKYHCFDEI